MRSRPARNANGTAAIVSALTAVITFWAALGALVSCKSTSSESAATSAAPVHSTGAMIRRCAPLEARQRRTSKTAMPIAATISPIAATTSRAVAIAGASATRNTLRGCGVVQPHERLNSTGATESTTAEA